MFAAYFFAASLAVASSASQTAHVIVRSYGSANVPASDLSVARASAIAVFTAADINLVWRNCDGPWRDEACDEAPAADEVIVRMVVGGFAPAAIVLGDAAVDVDERAGSLATIYVDRVAALAQLADVDRGTLLGRAIAHEVGHLLLGTPKHSRAGLMRALWTAVDLRRDRKEDWMLSREQAAQMRVAALARSGQREGQRHA
jgi:hypothetical protein